MSGRDGVRREAGCVLVPLTGRIKVNMETVRTLQAAGDNNKAPFDSLQLDSFAST